MHRKTAVAAIVTMLTLIIIIIFATNSMHLDTSTVAQSVFAQSQQKFTAKLTGKEEVPPTNTTATGIAQFVQSADGKVLNYKVSAMNINGVTEGNIQQGKAGEIGPTIVRLFKFNTPTLLLKNATLSEGNITSKGLRGPLSGSQISDLVKIIKDGNAYVNIHTIKNFDGEIRGQLSLSP